MSVDRAPSPATQDAPRRGGRRLFIAHPRFVLGAVAVAGLLAIAAGLAAFRYLPALDDARALRGDVERALTRVQAAGMGIDAATLDLAASDLASARSRLDDLSGILGGDPLVALARRLPPTASSVAGADEIAAGANDLLVAADDAMTVARRLVSVREAHATGRATRSTLEDLTALVAEARPAVSSASAAIQDAERHLAAVPIGLPGPLEDARAAMASRLERYAPLVERYAAMSARLPSILGWDRPRRYLVLTQDPAELRPTGGFIGSYGIVRFDRGRITERRFSDVAFDFPVDYPYVTPPRDLRDYLLGSLTWQFSDANWSPDFPTSAQAAIRLYANETEDADIDGVLGITTDTIDELLRITGPVDVPSYGATISAGETTMTVLQLTRAAPAPGVSRKAFLPAFADRLIDTLLALPPGRWDDAVGRADTFVGEHLLLAWFRDADDQAATHDAGLSGEVRHDGGDYVYPVDANVSPVSKLNVVTVRTAELGVEIDAVGNATDTLVTRWENRVEAPENAAYRAMPGTGSASLGMYYRVLTPSRTRLLSVAGEGATQVTQAAVVGEEAGRAVTGTYLRVPAGERSLTMSWVSPYAASVDERGGSYRLTVQRQPGVQAGPITITIRVPAGFRITAASAGMTVSDDTATLTLPSFERDLVVGLTFAPAPPT